MKSYKTTPDWPVYALDPKATELKINYPQQLTALVRMES